MTMQILRLILPFPHLSLRRSKLAATKLFNLSQKPEVLLPSSADKVSIRALASLPHSNCQALCFIDAELHKLLCTTASVASTKTAKIVINLLKSQTLNHLKTQIE